MSPLIAHTKYYSNITDCCIASAGLVYNKLVSSNTSTHLSVNVQFVNSSDVSPLRLVVYYAIYPVYVVFYYLKITVASGFHFSTYKMHPCSPLSYLFYM